MNAPFNEDPSTYTRMLLCSDCHASDLSGSLIDNRSDAKGAHGSANTVGSPDPFSNQSAMLIATIASDEIIGTPLCHVCHSQSNYWDGSVVSSAYPDHPSDQSAHQLTMGCFSCHMYDSSEYPVETGGSSEKILVHGQNKRYNTMEKPDNKGVFSAGQGQIVDAFVNGFIADMDFPGSRCWSEPDAVECTKAHTAKSY